MPTPVNFICPTCNQGTLFIKLEELTEAGFTPGYSTKWACFNCKAILTQVTVDGKTKLITN